jgi:hypothetical protein
MNAPINIAAGGLPVTRTEKGLAYDKVIREIRGWANSSDPEVKAEWLELNAEITSSKAASNAILHSYVLNTLSVAYQNDVYIGERLMPPINVNGRMAASYYTYGKRDQLAYPDDTMADRANANELSRTRTLTSISLTPRALREYVDELTMNNPEQPLNELVEATNNTLEGILFRREKRIAATIGVAASYGTNTTALAAADRWDVSTGDPIGAILDLQPAIWGGRGQVKRIGFTSHAVWNKLRQHASIKDILKAQGNGQAVATTQMLASWLELDELLIGKAWEDTANEGQAAATYARIWPDVFGVVQVATSPSTRNAFFGATFQDRAAPESDVTYAPERGTDGGWYARSKISDAHAIIAPDAGYLLTSVIG